MALLWFSPTAPATGGVSCQEEQKRLIPKPLALLAFHPCPAAVNIYPFAVQGSWLRGSYLWFLQLMRKAYSAPTLI